MKVKQLFFSSILIICSSWWYLATPVQASNQDHINFEVAPMIPAEQADQTERFFDLDLTPGTTKTIQTKIHNNSQHAITVHSTLTNSQNQLGGGIVFHNNLTSIIRNQHQALTKLAQVDKVDQTIRLQGNQTKTVQATIQMPSTKLSGLVYGAWHFIEYGADSEKQAANVTGNYAYEIGVVLRGQPYRVYPELKYQTTTPILAGGYPALGIKINNTMPMVIKNANIKAVVQRKGVFQEKRTFQNNQIEVAPNSQLTIPVSWGYDRIKPGHYTIDVVIKGQNLWNQLPMTWHFKKKYTVAATTVKKINQNAVKRPTNYWTYVTGASALLTLLTGTFVYRVFRWRG